MNGKTVEELRYNGKTLLTANSIIKKFFPEQDFETMDVRLNGEEMKVPVWLVRQGQIINVEERGFQVEEDMRTELVGGVVDGMGRLADLQVRIWEGEKPVLIGFVSHQAQ